MMLNLVLFLPLLGFLAVLLLPKETARMGSLLVSLGVFVLSLGLIGPVFDSPAAYSFVTDNIWIASPQIHYHLGIDGLSLWLVILSTFLTPICILASWTSIQKRVKEFFALLLLLEFGVIGVFISLDLFLFYVFFEVSLVPMFLLIGVWGHDKRIYAAVKFFLYTLAGSLLMLGAMIFLYNRGGTFDYVMLLEMLRNGKLALNSTEQFWLFMAFFIAFAIKVPLFPLHTWLPDAHGEAPTAGSIMLASVMLKMGTYGLLRFNLPMFPSASRANAGWIVALAIIGIIYGALVAMVQPNMKRLVAYSSVSHLGFVVLGIFSFNQIALDGAVYQMLNHGISTGALFLFVGYLYERRHSLEIKDYGGVATPAPQLAAVFMVAMLASVGLPTLNNFVGEFLVLQGAALVDFKWAVFAAVGVILSAVYMLWMYQRTFFGDVSDEVKHHMPDLTVREWAISIPLIVMMIWMGMGSGGFLAPIGVSNSATLLQTKRNVDFQVKTTPSVLAQSGETKHAR
jgi:NADH-quinone oxidoreductase subunit M